MVVAVVEFDATVKEVHPKCCHLGADLVGRVNCSRLALLPDVGGARVPGVFTPPASFLGELFAIPSLKGQISRGLRLKRVSRQGESTAL